MTENRIIKRVSDDTILNRNDLYEQVWSVPMYKLATKYGLSGNGLKKICQKLHIPVPPRGYWVKVQYGQRAKKKALPKLKYGDPETYTLSTKSQDIDQSKFSAEANELLRNNENKTVTVPERLASPHPLVKKTYDFLKKEKPWGEYGVISSGGSEYLDVRLAPGNLKRGMRILNALIKEV